MAAWYEYVDPSSDPIIGYSKKEYIPIILLYPL